MTSSINGNEPFLKTLLSEIESCLNYRHGSFHMKDPNKENGNPGLLLSNIIFQAIGERNGQESLSHQQKAEFRQWIEFVLIYGHCLQGTSSSHQIFKELNSVLAMKSFLTSSSSQTVIDAVFYGLLHKVISTITFQEKEQYIHLCRWFNTLQHDEQVRRSRPLVIFSRCPLYS